MKKITKLLVLVFSLVILCSCGAKVAKEDAFTFQYKDLTINLGDELDKDKLGEELNYSETQSCAFEGLDKTYTYEHFEITTNPYKDGDKIGSIYFLDDEVTTIEGLKKGDSLAMMEEIYGKDYALENSVYTYTKGKTELQFLVQDDTIISIEYLLLN